MLFNSVSGSPVRPLGRRVLRLLVPALVLLSLHPASPALARKGKSVANEARWIGFDPATNTVRVTIMKKGKGNKALLRQFEKQVKKGKEATFHVIPTGSVLTRTTVAVNGVKGELGDIREGKRVVVYWIEDPKHPGELFARKIDVVFTEEELRERYDIQDE